MAKDNTHLCRLAAAVSAAERSELQYVARNLDGLISWLDEHTRGVDGRVEVRFTVAELGDFLSDAADAAVRLNMARYRLTSELRKIQREAGNPEAWCQPEVEQ